MRDVEKHRAHVIKSVNTFNTTLDEVYDGNKGVCDSFSNLL